MTHTQKDKVHQPNRHMSQDSQAQQNLLLKRKKRLIRKLKQNLTPTQTIRTQILKTLMKKRRKKEEQQKKLNLLQNLCQSRTKRQKLLHPPSFKHQLFSQFRHQHNNYNSHQFKMLIPCSTFSRAFQRKCSNHQSNRLQLRVLDSFNQLNLKSINSNPPKQLFLVDLVLFHSLSKCNKHNSTSLETSVSQLSRKTTKIVLTHSVDSQILINNLNKRSRHQLISLAA